MSDKLDQPISLKTKDGKDFDVPVDGSLGVLALGYKGIMLWRQKREAVAAQRKDEAETAGTETKETDDSKSSDS
ncbi:MAG: hypothetical protein ACI959_000859 [Limisphaerales bacterium]|jgi:hypothetical protein